MNVARLLIRERFFTFPNVDSGSLSVAYSGGLVAGSSLFA